MAALRRSTSLVDSPPRSHEPMRTNRMSRSRSPVSRRSQDDPVSEDFKAFVGGVAWQLNDRELKESELSQTLPASLARLSAKARIKSWTSPQNHPIRLQKSSQQVALPSCLL